MKLERWKKFMRKQLKWRQNNFRLQWTNWIKWRTIFTALSRVILKRLIKWNIETEILAFKSYLTSLLQDVKERIIIHLNKLWPCTKNTVLSMLKRWKGKEFLKNTPIINTHQSTSRKIFSWILMVKSTILNSLKSIRMVKEILAD